MMVRHRMIVVSITGLSHKLEGLARLKVLICVAAAIDAGRRFTPELCYRTRV